MTAICAKRPPADWGFDPEAISMALRRPEAPRQPINNAISITLPLAPRTGTQEPL